MARFNGRVGRLAAECSLMELLGVKVAGEWIPYRTRSYSSITTQEAPRHCAILRSASFPAAGQPFRP